MAADFTRSRPSRGLERHVWFFEGHPRLLPQAGELVSRMAECAEHGKIWRPFGWQSLRRFGAGKESLRELAALARAGNAILVFAQGRHARPEQERAGDRAADFKMGVESALGRRQPMEASCETAVSRAHPAV